MKTVDLHRHGLSLEGLRQYAIGVVLFIPIISGVMFSTEYLYNKTIPTSLLFEYHKIEAVNHTYVGGDTVVRFKSYNEWKAKHLHVQWDDEIHCKYNDVWLKVKNQVWKATKNIENNTQFPNYWSFHVRLPQADTTCKLVSHITVKHGGVTKPPVIFESEEFNVIPQEPRV